MSHPPSDPSRTTTLASSGATEGPPTGAAKRSDVLRDELAQAAEAERRAEVGLDDARRQLRAVILKASEEGLSKAAIARLTRRSRQTIHRDLERAQRERSD